MQLLRASIVPHYYATARGASSARLPLRVRWLCAAATAMRAALASATAAPPFLRTTTLSGAWTCRRGGERRGAIRTVGVISRRRLMSYARMCQVCLRQAGIGRGAGWLAAFLLKLRSVFCLSSTRVLAKTAKKKWRSEKKSLAKKRHISVAAWLHARSASSLSARKQRALLCHPATANGTAFAACAPRASPYLRARARCGKTSAGSPSAARFSYRVIRALWTVTDIRRSGGEL